MPPVLLCLKVRWSAPRVTVGWGGTSLGWGFRLGEGVGTRQMVLSKGAVCSSLRVAKWLREIHEPALYLSKGVCWAWIITNR